MASIQEQVSRRVDVIEKWFSCDEATSTDFSIIWQYF